jgi:hypothetical protein
VPCDVFTKDGDAVREKDAFGIADSMMAPLCPQLTKIWESSEASREEDHALQEKLGTVLKKDGHQRYSARAECRWNGMEYR